MATDATIHISYCALLRSSQSDSLGSIRLWPKIKMASEGELIWLSDLDYAQIHSLEIKSIPYIKLYAVKDNKLYPLGSQLPEANFPSLLFTPIQRAIQVTLGHYNHNHFGLEEEIHLNIEPSNIEKDVACCLVALMDLKKYLEKAPAIRLKNIKWVLLNKDLALLMGTPLLPLPGKTFYRKYDFLIPSGFDLSLHLLQDSINDKINPDSAHWVLWHTNSNYALIEKDAFQALSRSSFTLTQKKIIP